MQHLAPPAGADAPVHGPLHAIAAKAAMRFFFDRAAEFWRAEVDATWSRTETRARVTAVVDETPDMKTVVLEPAARWAGHRAGQYAPVTFEVNGVRVRRCYSISTAPGGGAFAITVKRVPGGRVSNWIHDRVGPGTVVRLGEAAGDFVVAEGASTPLLLLTGGSGITPAMAIVRDLARRNALRDVVFVHCARTAADVAFRAELETLATRHPGFRLHVRCDDAHPGEVLGEAALRAMVPDFAAREAMLCGPAGMMDAMEAIWTRAGAIDRLRRERFGEAPRPAVGTGEIVAVNLVRAGRYARVASGAPLLDALEAAGEKPAHGCRQGICNTCRCHKRSGTTVDLLTGAVSSEPGQEIRLCVTAARGDVDIDL